MKLKLTSITRGYITAPVLYATLCYYGYFLVATP